MKQFSKRLFSLLLVMAMLLSLLPMGALAAPASDLPENMIDSPILRALEYTGYDVQKQKDNGTLYQSGHYGSSIPSDILSGINYGTSTSGKETVADSSTPTGLAPDIAKFMDKGLCCASFVTYYFSYIINVEGADAQFIMDAVNATGWNSQSCATWRKALTNLTNAGAIEKIGTSQDNVDRSKLAVGDIVMFGNSAAGDVHIAIYSGTYKGIDFCIHVGNNRGPEIMPIHWMENHEVEGKASPANGFWHIPEDVIQSTGKIEVHKADDSGNPLAGAYFVATSTADPTLQYPIGPTDSAGYASVDNVKYGQYKIVETVFPTNYQSSGQSEWTVTLDSSSPDGVVSIDAVNELIPGNCKIVKTSEDGIVQGLSFTIAGDGYSKTVTLDSNGTALVEGLRPGTYTVTEQVIDRYEPQAVQTVTITTGQTATVTFNNVLKKGTLKVTKTSEDGLTAGVQFKLSGTSLSGQAVELYAETDANGVATFTDVLISGSTPYVLEEVNTALKYVVPATQNVSIDWNEVTNASVHNELKRGDLKVTKTSEDRLVEGMKFKLSGTSLSGEAVELYATTDRNGVATFNDVLITGSTPYVLEEVDTAQRYIVPDAQEIVIEWNTVTNASVHNELKRGDVRVTKNSEDGLNAGVRFRLYGTSLSGASVNLYATTGEDGIAVFEDVLIGSNYTLVEVNTDVRYVIPEPQSVTVNWNEATECTVENILKKFKIEALKVDGILVYGEPDENEPVLLTIEDETEQPNDQNEEEYLPWPYGSSQGDATLEGAVYGMYRDGELLDTYVTDENGRFTTKYYPCGDGYYLLELSPSEGYLIDPWEYYIYAWPGMYTVELNTEYYELYEEIIRGQIEIVKHTDDGETKFETPEVGAAFEVYLKSAGSFAASNEWERDYLVIDEDGFAISKKLPYGTYVVNQLSGWEGRDYIPTFEVTISENEKMYRYIINNAEFESYIKVTKTDATTNKTIPYAGAAFQIYDPDGNLVKMQYTYPQVTVVDTFYTNADGILITPEKLPYGKGYSLVEVQATDGYVLDSTPVYFDVTRPDSEEENNILVINVTKGNMPQMGTVTITKTGEIFSSVTENDGIYQPVYELAGLEGAVFEIFAAEDIVTPDGTVRYTKGEKVDTITTGSDSKATSKELHLGKYQLKEIEAPYGMLLNGETVAFELTYAGQEVSVTSTAVTMTNERQKIVLDLKKAMEQDETFKLGMNGEISKVSFGLYAAEDIAAADGTKIPKDGLLEIAQCDAEGKAVFSTDVPVGSKLYVKEYATDDAYVPSDTTYPVEFVYAGQEVAAVIITVNNGETIQNELIRGSVEGLKKDEDGNVVAGAEFGLFWADTTEFTKENAILIATSDDAGVFRFENLPALKFIIKELACPEQFVLSDEIFEVEIFEDAQVINIEAINEFITGNVTATKTDKDTAEKLSGAVFEVYVDADGDKVFGERDVLYGTLTETEAGIYLLENLRYGGYFLHEKESPVNYNGNSEYHYFAITEDGKTVAIETTEGKGFENEAYKGIIQIIKKDAATGEVLSGVEFGLFDMEGNEIARGKTDDAGVLLFEQIRFGKYEIRELTPKEGYQKNETVTPVEITEDGQTVTVELTNEKIPEPVIPDNPKTGDESNIFLWFGLLIASLLGMVAVFIFRRRANAQ